MINIVKNIYSHLQDDKSQSLFENRLFNTMTEDDKYILRMIESMPQKKALDQTITFCKKHENEIVLYGVGNDLIILSRLYPDFRINSLCDGSKEKQKTGWRGIPVMSPEELLRKKDDVYVAITTSGFYEEIVSFLLGQGFKQEQIINLSLATDVKNQYFDPDIMTPQPGEVFIDGGCFNCSTDKAFINWCSGNYKKIIAFEPDRKNYLHCLEVSQKEAIRDIEIYNKGLWDCATELFFEETGGQGVQNWK